MPSRPADLRRDYRLHLQIGAAMALLLVLGAFTMPALPEEEMLVLEDPGVDITILDEIPPTTEPPPPPTPAPPPPVEVDDEEVIEDIPMPEVEMVFEDPVSVPRPPTPPGPPPVPPTVREEPPPPPVETFEENEDKLFIVVEQEPELIGGLEGLQRRVEYPEMARIGTVEGTVYIQFVVERDGSVSGATAVRSPSALLSDAALKAVRESSFVPGHQRGIPVRVQYTLPVRFVLR